MHIIKLLVTTSRGCVITWLLKTVELETFNTEEKICGWKSKGRGFDSRLRIFFSEISDLSSNLWYFFIDLFSSLFFPTGETYKLRASNTRERQVWVDRIRHVGQLFDVALAQNHHSVTSFGRPGTPPQGSRSHLSSNGLPSDALQNLSLSVLVKYLPVTGLENRFDLIIWPKSGVQTLGVLCRLRL